MAGVRSTNSTHGSTKANSRCVEAPQIGIESITHSLYSLRIDETELSNQVQQTKTKTKNCGTLRKNTTRPGYGIDFFKRIT